MGEGKERPAHAIGECVEQDPEQEHLRHFVSSAEHEQSHIEVTSVLKLSLTIENIKHVEDIIIKDMKDTKKIQT